jgi:hypothetical protein
MPFFTLVCWAALGFFVARPGLLIASIGAAAMAPLSASTGSLPLSASTGSLPLSASTGSLPLSASTGSLPLSASTGSAPSTGGKAAASPAAGHPASSKPAAASATPPPARPTMQLYSELLSLLLQNISAIGTPSPEQKNLVIKALQGARNSAHEVQATMALYTVDPIMRHLSIDMPKQFERIEQAYVNSNYAHARYLLRQTTQYCIACHSASSVKHSAVLQFTEPLSRLSDLEKAEYFAATRRHEDAMLAYEKALTNKQFKIAQPELWEQAVENLMAITIRIRNDAHITLEMCARLIEEGGTTETQREMLQSWRSSAKAWTNEKIGQKLSAAELVSRSQQLIERGDQLSRKEASFGYIEYMRAMNLLNELSMSSEPEAIKAPGYMLAGETGEKLRNVFLWMHPEAYYEACIRSKPRSPEAKRCYKNLENYQAKNPTATLEKNVLRRLSELSQ